jgi:hypothetical protein
MADFFLPASIFSRFFLVLKKKLATFADGSQNAD